MNYFKEKSSYKLLTSVVYYKVTVALYQPGIYDNFCQDHERFSSILSQYVNDGLKLTAARLNLRLTQITFWYRSSKVFQTIYRIHTYLTIPLKRYC